MSGSLEDVQPPEGYQIVERFPVTSAFKEVFRAIRITPIGQYPVVLKRYQSLSTKRMQAIMRKFRFTSQSQILAKDALTYWAGRVLHPNLVPCDIVQNGLGEIFLVEPLLDTTLDKKFPRSYRQFLDWAEELLTGLDYLHQSGYVHSDIKPDNLGLYRKRAVLLDFGISTRLGKTQERRPNPGSIKTRPPELFDKRAKPTTQSDMWSLGASLYYLLTEGDYPFVTRGEVANIPPAGSSRRRQFEEAIEAKARLALRSTENFRDCLDRSMKDMHIPELFRHLVLACLPLKPKDRSSASSLLNWLEVDTETFYGQDYWNIDSWHRKS